MLCGLKRPDGALGLRAVDAVRRAAVIAQRVEHDLHVPHVLAAHAFFQHTFPVSFHQSGQLLPCVQALRDREFGPLATACERVAFDLAGAVDHPTAQHVEPRVAHVVQKHAGDGLDHVADVALDVPVGVRPLPPDVAARDLDPGPGKRPVREPAAVEGPLALVLAAVAVWLLVAVAQDLTAAIGFFFALRL